MSWGYGKWYAKALSLPQSVIELFTQFGADVVLAHPPEFELMPEILDNAAGNAHKSGGSFKIVYDMDEAFVGADVVYPKSWGPLVMVKDSSKMVATIRHYKPWICHELRMSLAKEDAIYIHCLPADRG